MIVRCDCGFIGRGNEEAVIAQTQHHGRELHNMEVTPEQVSAMAKSAGDS